MQNKETSLLKIARTLAENISHIQYGEASVTLKVHTGRVVSVTHSVTENTRTAVSAGNDPGEAGNDGTE
jgi:hypothetical protein